MQEGLKQFQAAYEAAGKIPITDSEVKMPETKEPTEEELNKIAKAYMEQRNRAGENVTLEAVKAELKARQTPPSLETRKVSQSFVSLVKFSALRFACVHVHNRIFMNRVTIQLCFRCPQRLFSPRLE